MLNEHRITFCVVNRDANWNIFFTMIVSDVDRIKIKIKRVAQGNSTHRFGFNVFVCWYRPNIITEFRTTIHKQWMQRTNLRKFWRKKIIAD